jgi:hypothetical protein
MKNSMKFLGVICALALMAGLTSCKKDEGSVKVSDLTVSNVTENAATLSWAGTGNSYEVMINESVLKTTTSTSLTLTDLNAGTAYVWKVRATKDGSISEWVQGPAFTTKTPSAAFTINFDGNQWTPADYDMQMYSGKIVLVAFSNADRQSFPVLELATSPNGQEYSIASHPANSECQYFYEYMITDSQENPTWFSGDYVASSGSCTVTENDGNYVSLEANITMTETYAYYNQTGVNEKTLTVKITHMPFQGAVAVAEAVQKIGKKSNLVPLTK